jgi:hypothetical protein
MAQEEVAAQDWLELLLDMPHRYLARIPHTAVGGKLQMTLLLFSLSPQFTTIEQKLFCVRFLSLLL